MSREGVFKLFWRCCLSVALSIPALAQKTQVPFMLSRHQTEVGLFSALRFSTSDSVEWNTHPLMFLQAPNFGVTIQHHALANWSWASTHEFLWPTYLLRRLSREGTGGLISPEFTIPQMFALKNSIVFSKRLAVQRRIWFKLGLQLAIKFGRLDPGSTIDLPYIYPRLAVFYNGYQFLAGIRYYEKLNARWSYQLTLNGFFADQQALEASGWLAWSTKRQTQIRLGWFLSYAQYPFGSQLHLLIPLLDVVWHWEFGK